MRLLVFDVDCERFCRDHEQSKRKSGRTLAARRLKAAEEALERLECLHLDELQDGEYKRKRDLHDRRYLRRKQHQLAEADNKPRNARCESNERAVAEAREHRHQAAQIGEISLATIAQTRNFAATPAPRRFSARRARVASPLDGRHDLRADGLSKRLESRSAEEQIDDMLPNAFVFVFGKIVSKDLEKFFQCSKRRETRRKFAPEKQAIEKV